MRNGVLRALLFGTSFRPRYGGPAISVSRLALALAEAGVEVGLWAPDGSAQRSQLIVKHPLLTALDGSVVDALCQFGEPDIIHDNGIWLPHNHRVSELARKRRIPRVVSLRGMLEPWAMGHKRWKKKLAWLAYQSRDLRTAQLLHATAEREASNARGLELGVSVVVIANGVDLPEKWWVSGHASLSDASKEKRRALFLGRIYPVKGLPMLIEAWALVRPYDWVLQIAGPDEAGHRLEVEALVRAKGLENAVSFVGQVEAETKSTLYRAADLFVLPTHSESFGMVIAEALAHGVPVLTTRGAPWPLLEANQCGWWVDPTVDGLAQGLRRATACGIPTLRSMGERGRSWVEQKHSWDGIARQFVEVYENLL